MPLVTTKEMFKKAYENGYAIGAFNVDNVDIMKAVLKAAENKQAPVIIAISSGALKFIGENYVQSQQSRRGIRIHKEADPFRGVERGRETQ